MAAAAKVTLHANGRATVQCATHDLGTGAYTAFTQISSEQLGVPFEKVTFELGVSDYPFGPVAGGSNSTGTVGTPIHEAAGLLHRALAELAAGQIGSPLQGISPNEITMISPGRIGSKKGGPSPIPTPRFCGARVVNRSPWKRKNMTRRTIQSWLSSPGVHISAKSKWIRFFRESE